MKNTSETPNGNAENLSFEERLDRMYKMRDAVIHKRKEDNLPLNEDDGPIAIDRNNDLIRFEKALDQAIIVSGDVNQQREFNLKLDRKLEEYRRRKQTAGNNPESNIYKDSLYKLVIANALRIEGTVKLEDAYKNIEEMIGGQVVDPEIFWNSWNVIKAYAEGRPQQVVSGTGLK